MCRIAGIHENQQAHDETSAALPCMVDKYIVGFKQRHGNDLECNLARIDISTLNFFGDIDQSDIERSHMKRQRKCQTRGWTDGEDMATVAADQFGRFISQNTFTAERADDSAPAAAPLKARSIQSERVWAYRVFRHMESKGQYHTKDVAKDISMRWSSLSEEDRKVYLDLGRDAKESYEAAGMKLKPKPPKRTMPMLTDAVGNAADVAAIVPHDGHDVGTLAVKCANKGNGVSVETISSSLIVKEANLDRDVVLSESRLETEAACDELSLIAEKTRSESLHVVPECGLTATTGVADDGYGTFDVEFSQHFDGVMMDTKLSSEKCIMAGLACLEESSVMREAAEWRSKCAVVQVEHCDKLGNVASRRSLCEEAEYCVCAGAGMSQARFAKQLAIVFANAGDVIGKKTFKHLLLDGDLVLQFVYKDTRQVLVRPRPEDFDGVCPATPQIVEEVYNAEQLFHLCFHYQIPWKPSWLQMAFDPDRHRAGVLAVTPVKSATIAGAADWRNLWEMLRSTSCEPDSEMTISMHRLFADTRPVPRIDLRQQRIKHLDGLLDIALWKARRPYVPRKKAPASSTHGVRRSGTAGRKGGRGRSGRGRGRKGSDPVLDDVPVAHDDMVEYDPLAIEDLGATPCIPFLSLRESCRGTPRLRCFEAWRHISLTWNRFEVKDMWALVRI